MFVDGLGYDLGCSSLVKVDLPRLIVETGGGQEFVESGAVAGRFLLQECLKFRSGSVHERGVAHDFLAVELPRVRDVEFATEELVIDAASSRMVRLVLLRKGPG